MANTLTISALTENIYRARDIVARELVGFIPSVLVNSGSEGVSIGGTVKSFVTAAPTLNSSITPAMTIPAADDQTITAEDLTIGQAASVRIPIEGEKWLQLQNTSGGQPVLDAIIAQAIRKLVNTIEAHVATVTYKAASRATGTAGTTPFASNFNIIADARKILVDNGMPLDGQSSLVLDTAAGTKLRQLANIYKVNENGGDEVLRRGVLLDLFGFMVRESAQVQTHTKGTNSGSTTNNAGYAIGSTTLTLASAGTGTIVAGDVLAVQGDANNLYVVKTGDADVSNGGTVVLNNPGLMQAAAASTRTLTTQANYTANIALHRSAVELVVRPPANPPGGDAAVDAMTVYDPVSGLTFLVSQYKGYRMNMLEFACYYQAKAWKSDFIATVLG